MSEKNINKYKPKKANVIKLKEYLRKINNGESKVSINTKRIQNK